MQSRNTLVSFPPAHHKLIGPYRRFHLSFVRYARQSTSYHIIPLLKKKHFSLINTVVWYLSFFLLMLYNNVSTVVYYDKNIIFIQIRLQVWKRRQFTSYLWSERIKSNCKSRSKRLANPWLRLIYFFIY